MDIVETTSATDLIPVRDLVQRVLFTIAFALCAIVGVIGNTLVIIVIYRDPGLRIKDHLSNFLVAQLAVTDIMTSAFCSLPAAITIFFDKRFIFGVFCNLQAALNLTAMCASWHTLGVITIDRFIAVKFPLHYPQIVTPKRMYAVCAFVWAFSIWAGFTSAFWRPYWASFEYWVAICDFDYFNIGTGEGFIWVCFSWTAHFVVPALYVLPMNAAIVYLARKGKKKASGGKSGGCLSCFKSCWKKPVKTKGVPTKQQQEDKQAGRVLLSMMIVTFAFLALSSPTGAVRFSKIFFPNNRGAFPTWLEALNQLGQFLASVVNPFVYAILRKDFKNAFKALLK